jgi:hypothetical protein
VSDETKNRWACVAVQNRRAIGIFIDLLFAWLICLTPWVAHGPIGTSCLGRGLQEFIYSPFADPRWVFLLACSPFPLICLRLMCKVVMKTPTPGEIISGVSITSSGSFGVRLFQNFAFALWQHISVILALVCAIGPVLITSILLRTLTVFCPEWVIGALFLPACLAILVFTLGGFYRPGKSGGAESRLDKILGLHVSEQLALSPCLPAPPQ